LVRRWLITLHSKQRNEAEKCDWKGKIKCSPLGGGICFAEDIKQKPSQAKPTVENSRHVGVTKNSDTELIKNKNCLRKLYFIYIIADPETGEITQLVSST